MGPAHHHNHHSENTGDTHLTLAVSVNMVLTLVQVIGGVISGSLSLVADALHNFSDAAALGIALIARKVGRKPANQLKTFGYKRAEVVAALINLVTLVIVGLYLIYEALMRFFEPEPIAGWVVFILAGVALVIDVATAILTYTMSRHSLNIKAAFLHNVSDALASVGVMVAGALIILYQWYWVDTLITLMIAGYILYQGFTLLPETIHILMEGSPKDLETEEVIRQMEGVTGVKSVHHVHIWQLDEHRNALEAHVVVHDGDINNMEQIKTALKAMLEKTFSISHSTLEIERVDSPCQV